MTLDQANNIQLLIAKFGLVDSKPTKILMKRLTRIIFYQTVLNTDCQHTAMHLYRLDISADVNILSHRNEFPRDKYWEAAKKNILYLKTTINLKLTYTNTENLF